MLVMIFSAENDIADGRETARINEIHAITCDPSTDRLYYTDLDRHSSNFILRMVNTEL